MSAAAHATTSTARSLLSIGQVLAKLSPEFTDLTPSKLRFLEEQGLVTPARTASGYRKFSPADVDRLRLVLSMQRDHYLPLKVIRQHLEEIDSGANPALPNATSLAADSLLVSRIRYTREEVAKIAGASLNLLQDAVSAGMIEPAESYGEETVAVLTAIAELQRSGIEPRHMRTMRASAEREYSLIERALVPVTHRQGAASKARAAERAHDIARHIETVRTQLLRQIISQESR
ncbi:MerR family transcriptional regulator [Alpinimonas psychrophila]|uniref:DNA-binding transcriptional MerR regulator n=1 Tax=Alpinimonas psychrophila TaxID=748908 RepID=A0A7W3JSB0_9MICO|nr:DNA-binding transcriptional MerR regulator [Alpinimonas psychrophila]